MWFRVCLAGLSLSACAQAAYGPEDTLKLNAELGTSYDSNLFKLEENNNNHMALQQGTKSDIKTEARIGGRLDLKLSRQLLHISADINQISYRTFKDLNHRDWNTSVVWDWLAGNRLRGQLSAAARSSMSSFEDKLPGTDHGRLDMQQQSSLNWQGELKLKSSLALIASAGISSEEHDVNQYIDAKSKIAGLAIRYQTDQGNFFMARHSWRKYTYDLDLPFRSGFTEQISAIEMGYSPGSKIDLNATLGLSRWDSAADSQTTPQGDFTITWRPGDKTRLRLTYGQNFSEFTSGLGRNLDRQMTLNTVWQMTEKTGWDMDLYRRDRSFEVAGGIFQDERTHHLRLGLNYQPILPLLISSYLQAEQRSSNNINSNYKDYQFGLGARFNY